MVRVRVRMRMRPTSRERVRLGKVVVQFATPQLTFFQKHHHRRRRRAADYSACVLCVCEGEERGERETKQEWNSLTQTKEGVWPLALVG